MEEDEYSFKKPHLVQQQYINAQFQANSSNIGKSFSPFFLKFLLIAFFVSLLPLFPSEPPEFISNTVFAKSWELIHLLIIGIAFSYGLFCRPKTPQIPSKPQISQPHAPNIFHHSSIFDYEEGNPSGVSKKNAIPTQTFNLSHYREEPFVVSRRESCKEFGERPLGLPVRSLSSRVVESDSEEEEEEVCASECDSDLNGSSLSSTSEKDEKNLEGNMSNSSPTLCKPDSMRRDYFMAGNSKFEGKQSYFEPFRAPVPAASSCQNFSGFCSWLPESPNMDRENCWRENNFYMPFSNFNQGNDFNMVGMSPNLQNTANIYMPPAAAHPSMQFSASNFGLNSRKHNHENEHWGKANFENENMSVENTGFSMPSTAGPPPSVSIPATDFASRFRKHNHESETMSKLPSLRHETSDGGSPNLFMPSVACPSSMSAFGDNNYSSISASKNAMFHQGFFFKKNDEMGSENNNVTMCGQNTNISMPSAAFSPSMPASVDDSASSLKASKNSKFNYVSLPKKKDEMRSENNNVASGRENKNFFMPSAAFPPSMSVSTSESASSVRAPKDYKFNHVSSVKKKDEMRSENNNVALGRENTQMNVYANDSGTSVKASKNSKFNHVSSVKKKDEVRSENNNVALGRETTQIFMPSASFSPSMPVSTEELASSVKASKESKFSRVSSLKKKDEMRSENNNVTLDRENAHIFMPSTTFSPSMPASTDEASKFNHKSSLKKKDEMNSKDSNVAVGSFQEVSNSCHPHSDLLSGGKSPKLENGNMDDEIPNCFENKAEVLPTVTHPVDQFASSVKASRSTTANHKACIKKDQERSNKENAGSFGEREKSNVSHFVDPFCFPISRVDILPKKNEQNSIPKRWGDDCFVIPSSENNGLGDILLENLSASPPDSSEAPSSAGPSRRRSSHEQGPAWNKADEDVPRSAQMNNSEIESVADDVVGESDAYKPSTPSPPPKVQARAIDRVASSVESSSRALGNQSFFKNDNDDQGSPPTPERRKALSRVSHSRRFSCGSFFDRDLRKSVKDEAKGANKKSKGDDDQFLRGGMCGWDCLKLDVKPAFNKAALKGKSVRTVRPKEIAHVRQNSDQIELKCEENHEGLAVANGAESKGEKSEMMVIKIGISEKRSNSSGRKGEKLQGNGGTTSILVGLNSKHNSNGTTGVLDDGREEKNDGEIDKKADEFIAKFKEQIRLQRVTPRSVSSRQHKKFL